MTEKETPPTPWEQATGNQRSKRQEKGLAARPGGRQQVNSGRTWFSKRDVRLNGYLVEARTTEAASYTVSRPEFEALTKQALSTPPGQLPGMQVDFTSGMETLSLFIQRLEDHEYWVQHAANLEAEIERLRKLKTPQN